MGSAASSNSPRSPRSPRHSPRSVAVRELDLADYDHDELKVHKSGRTLGKNWRLATLVPDAHVEDAWRDSFKAKPSARRRDEKRDEKQRYLSKHSASQEIDEKMEKDKAARDAAARAAADAKHRERTSLRKAWHQVTSSKKYFCRARGFVRVAVFANHDGEYVAAAAKPHADAKVESIHFQHDDLPVPPPRRADDRSLEELRMPPALKTEVRAFLGSNRLTISRSFESDDGASDDDDDRLSLELVDVPHVAAARVLSPPALRDLEGRVLPADEVGRPSSPSRFGALAAGARADLRGADATLDDVERGHASLVRDADRLHDLHVHDAAVLDGLGHLSPTKKRRFVAAPVVDTHWHKTRTMHAAVANLWDP